MAPPPCGTVLRPIAYASFTDDITTSTRLRIRAGLVLAVRPLHEPRGGGAVRLLVPAGLLARALGVALPVAGEDARRHWAKGGRSPLPALAGNAAQPLVAKGSVPSVSSVARGARRPGASTGTGA